MLNIITFVGMIRIVLIGGGNLAGHLATVFYQTEGLELVQMYNRTLEKIKPYEKFTQITDQIHTLAHADLYIICVSDVGIAEVSQALLPQNGLIVHTSGATSIDVLQKHSRRGVWYPLQSFTSSRTPDFSEIPICVESNHWEDLEVLKQVARKISQTVYEIDSNQRLQLHLAAVWVNNFVNHLYHVGFDYLEKQQLPQHILFPLIKETALRIHDVTPYQAQTGPAKRGDLPTMHRHLNLLEDDTQKALYKLISHSISQTYGKKL